MKFIPRGCIVASLLIQLHWNVGSCFPVYMGMLGFFSWVLVPQVWDRVLGDSFVVSWTLTLSSLVGSLGFTNLFLRDGCLLKANIGGLGIFPSNLHFCEVSFNSQLKIF